MNTFSRLALLVALGLTPSVQADELGRLFFSPDERQQLDRQHARQATQENGANTPSHIIVNGLIQHGDGSRTVWINGKAQRMTSGKNTDSVPVILPGRNESVEVKVGQRLQLDSLPSQTVPPPAATSEDKK